MSVERAINERIKWARKLNQILHYEPLKIHNADDAQLYIDRTKEYRYLTQMFYEMDLTHWNDKDFVYEEK